MKPIISEGDYVLSLFDENDNEIEQVHITEGLTRSIEMGKEALEIYPDVHSYRVMRCLKNSKYNIHSPGPKT